MKARIWVVGIFIILAAGLSAALFLLRNGESEDSRRVRVSGNIEVTDVQLSFKIAGRVASREVEEGERVEAGQPVARLETDDLEHELALRQAEVRVAKAALAELEAGARPEEIEQADAALSVAQSETENARREFERQNELYEKAVATSREMDRAKTAFETSQARIREAEARLALLRKGPRLEQIEQAQARLEQAGAGFALAETRLADANLVSPLSGLVLSKNVEAGEQVAPGTPIVTVGDLSRPWLRAYISETDLGRVKLGQRVLVSTDTYPDKRYEGALAFIAAEAEFTPKNVQTHRERVKLVYRIKVDLPNPNLELKPGMPADAEILVE